MELVLRICRIRWRHAFAARRCRLTLPPSNDIWRGWYDTSMARIRQLLTGVVRSLDIPDWRTGDSMTHLQHLHPKPSGTEFEFRPWRMNS